MAYYIPTTGVNYKTRNGSFSNGVYTPSYATNLTQRGYPSSYNQSTTGLNLTQRGYPSSTEGYYGGNVNTYSNLPSSNTGGSSYSGYNTGRYSNGLDGEGEQPATNPYAGQMEAYLREIEELKKQLEDKTKTREAYEKLLKEFTEKRTDYNKLYNNMTANYKKQWKQQQKGILESAASSKKSIQNNYKDAKKSLYSQRDADLTNLKKTRNSNIDKLKRDAKTNRENQNKQAEDSLRQAYVNKMMNERGIGQKLSAMGLNGGASESALLGIANNYGNARNDINTTLADNLADIDRTYANNVADINTQYASDKAGIQSTARANKQAALREANQLIADWKSQKATNLLNALNGRNSNYNSAYEQYQNLVNSYNTQYLALLQAAAAAGADIGGYEPMKVTIPAPGPKTKTGPALQSKNIDPRLIEDGPLINNKYDRYRWR